MDDPDLVPLSRDGRIRTDDLSVPNAARYQAAPRPDLWALNGRRPWEGDAHLTLSKWEGNPG